MMAGRELEFLEHHLIFDSFALGSLLVALETKVKIDTSNNQANHKHGKD
jgi:hypothetical protein